MVSQKISFLQPSLWSQILTGGKGGVAPPAPGSTINNMYQLFMENDS